MKTLKALLYIFPFFSVVSAHACKVVSFNNNEGVTVRDHVAYFRNHPVMKSTLNRSTNTYEFTSTTGHYDMTGYYELGNGKLHVPVKGYGIVTVVIFRDDQFISAPVSDPTSTGDMGSAQNCASKEDAFLGIFAATRIPQLIPGIR